MGADVTGRKRVKGVIRFRSAIGGASEGYCNSVCWEIVHEASFASRVRLNLLAMIGRPYESLKKKPLPFGRAVPSLSYKHYYFCSCVSFSIIWALSLSFFVFSTKFNAI